MTDLQKIQIEKVVNTVCSMLKMNDENTRQNLIAHLSAMNEIDAIDYLIVSLHDLIKNNRLKIENAFSVLDLTATISNKYPTRDDLLNRLQWLKSMNMFHGKMPLSENHILVTEVFDKFNQIIGTDFDAYYTGGLMGYLVTNHSLERYHSDLDLFINEAQLSALYARIQKNPDFTFASNLDKKDHTGHEFKINYKETPMSIGLFLFERKPEQTVVLKSYYHTDQDPQQALLVDEKYLSPAYAQMFFPQNSIHVHNQIPYRMQSLESIYLSKKSSRSKDKYDANIIRESVDLDMINVLENLQIDNYRLNKQKVTQPFILEFDQKIKAQNQISEQSK